MSSFNILLIIFTCLLVEKSLLERVQSAPTPMELAGGVLQSRRHGGVQHIIGVRPLHSS